MSAPDVLAVLRRTSEGLHGIADGCRDPDLSAAMRERAREFDAALAAVAELIEYAREASMVLPSIDAMSAETLRDLIVLRSQQAHAALARCGGAKS